MTEEEALSWLDDHVSRETLGRLQTLADLVREEQANQNLISASTLPHIWSRHIVDSAQLLALAGEGDWLDLGSGPGFPGLVIAATGRPVTLVESRAKRIQFLAAAAEVMDISTWTKIVGTRLELLATRPFATISARAFAPLDRLLTLAVRFSTPETIWVLPKGRGATRELEAIAGSWQGDFRIVPSITDPEAAIIVAQDVRPRKRS